MIKSKYKVGDIIKIIEHGNGNVRYYILAKVLKIIEKRGYNMYLCQNIKTKCRTTITDWDVCLKIKRLHNVREEA